MVRNAFYSRILPISSLLLLVLVKFQNCAPVNPSDLHASESVDGEVRLIDRWQPAPVSFLNSQQMVPADIRSLQIHGLCVGSEKGQKIDWQLISADTEQVLTSGQVECVMGGFQLPLDNVVFNSCSDKLEVRAIRSGDAEAAETILEPDCAPTS